MDTDKKRELIAKSLGNIEVDSETESKFRAEYKAKLDEIEAKYKDRVLTADEKKQRKLELLKIQKDYQDRFDEAWQRLSSEQKSSLETMPFAKRLKHNLKIQSNERKQATC